MIECVNEIFTRPEKPFLVVYEIDGILSNCWFNNSDAVEDLLAELDEWHKDKYEILDIVEIRSARDWTVCEEE